MAICKHDNVVELVERKCEPPPMPTCSNGLKPVRVIDPDGCCWHWECDCKALLSENMPARVLSSLAPVAAGLASWEQTLIAKHLL